MYAPEAGGAGEEIALPADEAAHVTRVLRLGRGDAVRVFDGRGREWQAAIASVARDRVIVRRADAVTPVSETRIRYVLAAAVLKGDATDEVVRVATTLGIAAFVPLVTARTERSLSALERGHRLERWRRIAVAAAKQCGRAVVPSIAAPQSWAVCAAAPRDGAGLLLAEPAAAAPARRLDEVPVPDAVVLAIGPEGGWTPEEVQAAVAAGWTTVGLGARTLRASDAPTVALAACQAVWHDA